MEKRGGVGEVVESGGEVDAAVETSGLGKWFRRSGREKR